MRLLVALLLLTGSLSAGVLENRLAGHPSPYLAMHGEDPVYWQPWSREVLDLAREEGRMIFVSSGYFSCHWCHVMQKESYRNPEIARLLNEGFISVKVDRELNTALDEHLIDFVQRTQGHAGWPLNVFLTPEGYPVAGMTYAPAEQFKTVLKRIRRLWEAEREQVTGLARLGLAELQKMREQESGDDALISPDRLVRLFFGEAMALADDLEGGFGQQNKFPMTPQLVALLQLQAEFPDDQVREFLKLTLEQMASQGLRDQLAGGFFRYTIDPQWRVPHYEKMLYTQALMALLYLDATERLQAPGYRAIAFDTLDFVIREMAGEGGGYVASLSAVDDKGVEGGYYLWNKAELERILTADELELAYRHWRLDDLNTYPEGVLPVRGEPVAVLARQAGVSEAAMADKLHRIRGKLLSQRRLRVLPVDHKQLAGWNGLLLRALAEASTHPGGGRYRQPARMLKNYLLQRHLKGEKLVRAVNGQGSFGEASLEDYAYVAWGLSAWATVVDSKAERELAEGLLTVAWQDFHGPGGWRSSDHALLPGMPAVQAQEDGAIPSPSAIIVRLSLASQKEALQQKGRSILPEVRKRVQRQSFWYPSHLLLLQ